MVLLPAENEQVRGVQNYPIIWSFRTALGFTRWTLLDTLAEDMRPDCPIGTKRHFTWNCKWKIYRIDTFRF